MTATGHAVIGTVIAATVPDPLIAIPLAFFSHIAADLFPHWDTATHWRTKGKYMLYRDSILDGLLALFLVWFLTRFVFTGTSFIYALTIVVFALLPDILTAPYLFLDWKFPPFSWAYRFQKMFDSKLDKPWGIIGQAALLVGVVLLGILIYNK